MGTVMTKRALHASILLVKEFFFQLDYIALHTESYPKASAVFRRQCLGSAHQPPAGDHTPAKSTTNQIVQISSEIHRREWQDLPLGYDA